MATLRSTLALLTRRSFINHSRHRFSTTTAVTYWNKDWKPGPLPRTPEERAAAAKKYGLRPEDYDCLAGGELGDYPNLPLVAKIWRDPFEDYDAPGIKRNYGEPIHPDNDIIGEDLWDPNADGRYTYWQQLSFLLMIAAGFVGAFLLASPYPFFLPQMPKQYPFNNLYLEKGGDPALMEEVKHYTFDPPGDDEC